MKIAINPNLTEEELKKLTQVMQEMSAQKVTAIHKHKIDRDSLITYPE